MNRLTRFGIAVLWLCLGLACASEEWDNPHDPESAAYRAPCSGVPAESAAGCVFWEDFDRGLSRWRIGSPPAGVKAVRVVPQSEDGQTTVLALPGCAEFGAPTLQTEIELPRGNLQVLVYWRAAPGAEGQLTLSVNGAPQFVSTERAGEAGYAGWTAAIANVTPLAGRTVVLRLQNAGGEGEQCAHEGIHVARVHLRQLTD